MFKQVPSSPNFAQQEEEILAFWQKNGIFEKSVEKNKDAEPFVIYDGPPTANALPPLHTMVPMSFKDFVGRYQTMRGRYVPRQAGWDTHGLPVEVQIEKKFGLTSKKDILNLVPGDERASIIKFNEMCRESVFEFKKEWDQFVPRVGYWTDTKHPYITYDASYIEGVWAVFKRVWDRGLVYKGYKVMPYCPRCGTGLSAAEVGQEYQDVKDTSVFVSFPIVEEPGVSFLAWTTTPWTLPGNVALAVGNDIDYVTVRQESGTYVLAKERLGVLKGEYEIVATRKGSELVGLTYEPLYPEAMGDAEGRKYCVVAADFVTTTDGSGIVHTAVVYGEDDFNLGKAEGLAMRHTVDLSGTFMPHVAEFAGMYIRDALVPILQSLTAKGRLYAKQTITHSYPHCWRCKTPLLYYAKDSWFVSMSEKRAELVANNAEVQWVPEHIKGGRFGEFVKEARDWAISRERFWGTPMPLWANAAGEHLVVGSIEELRSLAKDPSLVPADFDPHRPYVDDVILVKDGVEYIREPFVLDVWFDSGSMPYASGFEAKGLFPADFIAEAIDQTRGWFYTLMALGTVTKDTSPYRRVVCMGHLVDENGKKMSKSLGNVFNPWETFKIQGVDAIRWYLYTVNAPGESKAFSVKELQSSFRRMLMLYWNVYNYFVTYANVAGFEAPTLEEREVLRTDPSLGALDRWILSRQAEVRDVVTKEIDAYDFFRAGRAIEEYVGDLSTWYLRRSRKRSDAAFFKVMYDVLMNLSAMLAPFTPYMADQVYTNLRHESQPESVHLTDWPGELAGRNEVLELEMVQLRLAVEAGLNLRAEQKIKVRQPLAKVLLTTSHFVDEEMLSILSDELNALLVRHVSEELPGYVWSDKQIAGDVRLGLDIELTDELRQMGDARELQRIIQNLRKEKGFQPGQMVRLRVLPAHRSLVEPLLVAVPAVVEEAYLVIDGQSWEGNTEDEVTLNGETVSLTLEPLNVEQA
jgi:isoleucyl-tRNA synthetase